MLLLQCFILLALVDRVILVDFQKIRVVPLYMRHRMRAIVRIRLLQMLLRATRLPRLLRLLIHNELAVGDDLALQSVLILELDLVGAGLRGNVVLESIVINHGILRPYTLDLVSIWHRIDVIHLALALHSFIMHLGFFDLLLRVAVV